LNLAKEQLSFSSVTSDVDGVADDVNVRVGETFMGMIGATPQIRIVNTANLKASAQIPENYLGKVGVGTPVKITLPDLNRDIDAKVTASGKLIDPINRSFFIEAKIPTDKSFRPNQIALVRIQDYTAQDAITIPVNTLQTDDKGRFVMVAVKENGKQIARKKQVTIGELYGNKLEVKSGLQAGDVIISDGFQNLYDGQLLTTGK
jgi:RND family efflux transporter MFP subunit